MGQIVEKPQGFYGKSSLRGDSEAEGFSEGKPEGAGFAEAFRFSRGGTFCRYHQRLFHNLSDFGFLEVQGHSSQGTTLEKILENPQ